MRTHLCSTIYLEYSRRTRYFFPLAVKVDFEGGVKDEEDEHAQEEQGDIHQPGHSNLVLLYNTTSTLDAV